MGASDPRLKPSIETFEGRLCEGRHGLHILQDSGKEDARCDGARDRAHDSHKGHKPAGPGTLLVLSKEHHANILDCKDTGLLGEMLESAVEAAKKPVSLKRASGQS